MNAAATEAIAVADAHLNNVALPTYTELVEKLTQAHDILLAVHDSPSLSSSWGAAWIGQILPTLQECLRKTRDDSMLDALPPCGK